MFPHIEPLSAADQAAEDQRLLDDEAAIAASTWTPGEELALDEAQRVADADMERVRIAEGKATTYLAVLAALVPIIITLQAANWEKKAGPAPDSARLFVLAVATIYIAAVGYHAFKTLQVTGFQRVGEAELVRAWSGPDHMRKVIRGTLLASRRSRNAVNAKVTRIRVTHEHLLRAFGTFILLLLLDPLFHLAGFRNAAQEPAPTRVIVERPPKAVQPPAANCPAPATPADRVEPTGVASTRLGARGADRGSSTGLNRRPAPDRQSTPTGGGGRPDEARACPAPPPVEDAWGEHQTSDSVTPGERE
ncbi:hypothetical protein [Sphingomicrobium arenosum]|uniref:hypothetical protein n=1 Tax=Sphingomicrobium arenosum TaxID=2233861 RepID=UPI002240E88D|nr:hypothetical protein [Sphingomicrobium arenosum]